MTSTQQLRTDILSHLAGGADGEARIRCQPQFRGTCTLVIRRALEELADEGAVVKVREVAGDAIYCLPEHVPAPKARKVPAWRQKLAEQAGA